MFAIGTARICKEKKRPSSVWCAVLPGQIMEARCCECIRSESRVRGGLGVCLPAYLSAWLPSTVSCLMGSHLNGGGSELCFFSFPSPLLSQWNVTDSIHLLCLCHSSSQLNQPDPLRAQRGRRRDGGWGCEYERKWFREGSNGERTRQQQPEWMKMERKRVEKREGVETASGRQGEQEWRLSLWMGKITEWKILRIMWACEGEIPTEL